MYRIGIDLGGTKIEGVILDESGKQLSRKRIDTQQEGGYQHILNRIADLYRDLVKVIQSAPHTFGIGTPGAVSPRTGQLKNSNTACLNRQPFKTDLENILGRAVAMQNDANCFAMAEALYGAGRGHQLVFGVIMGTGCGGGIVHKGEVIVGRQGIAGEWGHTGIVPDGPHCYCGQRGCVETYISGGGAEARYVEKFGVKKTFREIGTDFYDGEANAVEFMAGFFRNFGRALANVIDILDPDVVILGGGVSNFNALYAQGVAEVAKFIFSDSLETPIVKHQLGDSAGVIGAALIGI
ncbi:MAG TPA: ROK family protein [Verrucomicrobiae bacterium]|jgi:fructokinase|nr:ROK family protein [Verrucomicrobiae bacterium]